MFRAAAIDIGTNSVLLTVVERDRAGNRRIVVDRCTITRLGQGVDKTRQLSPDAVKRTLDCIAGYAEILSELKVNRVDAVGTSALRDARSAEDFLLRAEEHLGVMPRVIAGDEEAQLTFRGALSSLDVDGSVTVLDIGGGSTELITGHRTSTLAVAEAFQSLDLGCVRMTERYVTTDPPEPAALAAISESARAALATLSFAAGQGTLVAVAGTATTLAAIDLGLASYDRNRVHGHVLSRGRLETLLDQLATLPRSERASVPGMERKRADVIVAGAVILSTVLHQLGQPQLVVSDRGVRFGLIESMLAQTNE